MSESTAGVTLLSFGNSSPDIFSTYGAMKSGSGSLAIGELIGAATFIVSVVAGSVMLISQFEVRPFAFFRDVGFFAVAVSTVVFVLIDGTLHLHECLLLIALYFCYAATIIIGNCMTSESSPPLDEEVATVASTLAEPIDATPEGSSRRPKFLPRHSLLGAIEFRDVLRNLRSEASADRSIELFTSHDPEMFLPYGLNSAHSLRHTPVLEAPPMKPSYSDGDQRRSIDHLHSPISSTPLPATTRPPKLRMMRGMTRALFPSLQNFYAKSWVGIVLSFVTAPAFLCLNLTLPVVDEALERLLEIRPIRLEGEEATLLANNSVQTEAEELHPMQSEPAETILELSKARKWLTILQCMLAPPFCGWAVTEPATSNRLVKIACCAAVGAGLAAITAWILWRAHKKALSPRMSAIGGMLRCFVGFIVAILWIMTIVDQVILILQTLGSVLGVSDASEFGLVQTVSVTLADIIRIVVMGLTIFAAGNSLGDLVANTSLARVHPVMAISACFAGPMLNLLLGIGISGTVILSSTGGGSYTFDFSPTLLVSAGGILLLLLFLLIAVPLSKFRMTARIGMCISLAYVAIMATNLLCEILL